MRINGEKFDDLLHGNLLMNVVFASAVGNLCMAVEYIQRECSNEEILWYRNVACFPSFTRFTFVLPAEKITFAIQEQPVSWEQHRLP